MTRQNHVSTWHIFIGKSSYPKAWSLKKASLLRNNWPRSRRKDLGNSKRKALLEGACCYTITPLLGHLNHGFFNLFSDVYCIWQTWSASQVVFCSRQVYGHVPPAQRVLLFAKLMGLTAMVRSSAGWTRNWDTPVTPQYAMSMFHGMFFFRGNMIEYNIKWFFWWNIIVKDLGILLSVSDHGSMNWMSVWSVGTFVQEPKLSETETNFQKSQFQFLQPRRHVWAMFWNHHVVMLFLKFLIGYARWVLCFVVRNEFVKLLKDLFHWTSREAQHIHCNPGDLYRWKNRGANLCKIPKWVTIPLGS